MAALGRHVLQLTGVGGHNSHCSLSCMHMTRPPKDGVRIRRSSLIASCRTSTPVNPVLHVVACMHAQRLGIRVCRKAWGKRQVAHPVLLFGPFELAMTILLGGSAFPDDYPMTDLRSTGATGGPVRKALLQTSQHSACSISKDMWLL